MQGPGRLSSVTGTSRNITLTGNLGSMGTAGSGVMVVDAKLMEAPRFGPLTEADVGPAAP